MIALRDKGFFDLIEPARAERLLEGAGQTVMAVEYEPGRAQGRIPADYLVIGWLRGDVGVADSTMTLAGEKSDVGDDLAP